MGLEVCPKCGGTELITDRRRIREKMHPKVDLLLIPNMDELDAICPDCDSFIKMFIMQLPDKERMLEMCRRTITDHDDEYCLEKRPK